MHHQPIIVHVTSLIFFGVVNVQYLLSFVFVIILLFFINPICFRKMPGFFRDGNIVILHSQNTGKNLRIMPDGSVNGHGGNGDKAQFKVHKNGKGIIKFQNVDNPHHWLRITNDHKLCGKGSGGHHCQFKKIRHDAGVFSFESVEHRGCHIGLKDNGDAKPANNTGTGKASRFSVVIHKKH